MQLSIDQQSAENCGRNTAENDQISRPACGACGILDLWLGIDTTPIVMPARSETLPLGSPAGCRWATEAAIYASISMVAPLYGKV
jgi:hypothetical protein